LGIEDSMPFVKRDIRITINGAGAKQQDRKNSTTQRGMGLSVQRSEVTRLNPCPRAKTRSRQGWKEREGTKFGGIRDGKENLVLVGEEGNQTIGRDSTSHQYGRAGRSRRTRAEMQPTVESAPTSVVGNFV